MKDPIFWKAAKLHGKPDERPPPNRFSDGVITVGCILFLIFSFGLWLSIDSSGGKIFYAALFLIPNYCCGEWLGGKIFSEESGLSISKSGFSILRIIVGVLIVLVVFGVVFGIWLLIRLLMLT